MSKYKRMEIEVTPQLMKKLFEFVLHSGVGKRIKSIKELTV
jgi:hypothetical protein